MEHMGITYSDWACVGVYNGWVSEEADDDVKAPKGFEFCGKGITYGEWQTIGVEAGWISGDTFADSDSVGASSQASQFPSWQPTAAQPSQAEVPQHPQLAQPAQDDVTVTPKVSRAALVDSEGEEPDNHSEVKGRKGDKRLGTEGEPSKVRGRAWTTAIFKNETSRCLSLDSSESADEVEPTSDGELVEAVHIPLEAPALEREHSATPDAPPVTCGGCGCHRTRPDPVGSTNLPWSTGLGWSVRDVAVQAPEDLIPFKKAFIKNTD